METYELTIQQKRILLMEQKMQSRNTFNLVYVCTYSFDVNPQIMKTVLYKIVQVNDFFHIKLVNKRNKVTQVFVRPRNIKFDYVDLKYEKNRKQMYESIIEQEKKRVFDLYEGELYNFVLVCFDQSTYYLVMNLHHLIADANCIVNIKKNILDYYNMVFNNKKVCTKSPKSYKNYIVDQQDYMKSSRYLEIQNYWRNMKVHQTYFDLGVQRQNVSKKKVFHIQDFLYKSIINRALEKKIPIVSYLLSALYILMYIYNGFRNCMIGFVSKGKKGIIGGEQVNGLFSLLVPFSLNLEKTVDILTIPKLVTVHLLDIIDNQFIDFSEVKEISESAMNFPVIFNMKELIRLYKSGEFGEKDVKYIDLGCLQYNLVYNLYQSSNEICIELEYNSVQYSNEFIERMTEHYVSILRLLVSKCDHKCLGEISVVKPDEKEKLNKFSMGKKVDIKKESLKDWFIDNMNTNSEKVAIYEGGRVITFKELDKLSDSYATFLRDNGVYENTVVISMLERSSFSFIIFWALIKIDCVYLPVSIDTPIDRLMYIIDDCKPVGIITTKKIHQLSGLAKIIDFKCSEIFFHKLLRKDMKIYEKQLRYIIYTSGTTGMPKGVKICEEGIKNLGCFFVQDLHVSAKDKILQFFNPPFDASIWEMLLLFFCGCSITVVDEATRAVPSLMEEFINKNNVTVITVTPSYLALLKPEKISTLRMVIAAGEQSRVNDVVKWNKYVKYINAYGPTETTICATVKVCEENEYDNVPIGRPICNMQLYILNENAQEVPIGIKGEICIGGVGVTSGYVGQIKSDNSKFIKSENGNILYRTNDVGMWNENGEVIYVGRLDNQIKLHGYRIELEEIETTILKMNMIQSASVIYNQRLERLIVYYCAESDIPNELFVRELSKTLPYYMVPRKFIRIKSMPISINNKIDRMKLSTMEDNELIQDVYTDDCSSIEICILEMWKEVLEIDIKNLDDNFFDIGGNSLKLFLLFDKLRTKFGDSLQIIDLFSYTTIREMARYIESEYRK